MLTEQQRTILQQAIELLEEADALVQLALGESDATQFTCTAIQEVVEDLQEDLQEDLLDNWDRESFSEQAVR